MNNIATFEKVSLKQFISDFYKLNPDLPNTDRTNDALQSVWEGIKLPTRADGGSAGYDFYAPVEFDLNPGDIVTIPTGIRCKMNEGWVLMLFPRSSLGFKYGFALLNTVGVIDQSYYGAINEGHIMTKVQNNGCDLLKIGEHDRFVQGIFVPYGITTDDAPIAGTRVGGMGSSGK